MKKLVVSFIGVLFLSACSKSEDAKLVVSSFFDALSDSTIKMATIYPNMDSLDYSTILSDAVDIEEEVIKKDNTYIINCLNSYTNKQGQFKQDSVIFYIEDSDKGLVIIDSKGLFDIPQDIYKFGVSTGAFKKDSKPYDVEYANKISDLKGLYFREYLDIEIELRMGVEITYWDWETGYSGEAHGQAWVKNNLSFTVPNIKYNVRYYDSKGNYVTEDEGTACRELHPGEKYRFSWWSSHAKYPNKANIRISFSDSFVEGLIENRKYSGKEFQEYVKSKKKDGVEVVDSLGTI